MEQTKFLGVVVQNNIRWNSHIEYIFKKKNAKGIGIIYKAKDKLMERAKISLYYALIYPDIHYCNAVWGNDYKTGLSVVHRQQKRLLWIIFGLLCLSQRDPFTRNSSIAVDKSAKMSHGSTEELTGLQRSVPI